VGPFENNLMPELCLADLVGDLIRLIGSHDIGAAAQTSEKTISAYHEKAPGGPLLYRDSGPPRPRFA
jgi:hypothetical protein